jgi:hypothetical protein
MDALQRFKGDVQHAIMLAAKKANHDQASARQLSNEFFFKYILEEDDQDKIEELAKQFCAEKHICEVNLSSKAKPGKKKLEKPEEKDETTQASFVETDDALYEQFYIKATRTIGYLRYDKVTQEITDADSVTHNGVKYVPYLGDELDVGAILLSENTQDYENTKRLLVEIQQFIEKYVDIPAQYRIYCSYYILLSWVYDKFNTINYLRVRGDLGQGKTRFLQTVGQLCYKPMVVSGAVGAAPVFRMISRWNGTLVMDESDFTSSDEATQLIKVLNVGYQKGMSVMRCDKNDPSKLDFFKVFGPKVISSRKLFDDQALESRCLTHEMYRTKRRDIPDTLIHEFEKEQQTLRNKLLLYRFHNYMKVNSDNINNIDLGEGIEPRLRQATRAFVALFMDDTQMLEDFKVFLRQYNQKLVAERSASIDGMIVRAISLLLQHGVTDISSKDILDLLSDTGDLWDRANSRSIGKRLSALGIQTRDKRLKSGSLKDSVRNCIVWESLDISIFNRYMTDANSINITIDLVANLVASSVCSVIYQDRHQPENLKCSESGGVCHITLQSLHPTNQPNNITPLEAVEEVYISDGTKEMIHQKCAICAATPCVAWGKYGRPICANCKSSLDINPTK